MADSTTNPTPTPSSDFQAPPPATVTLATQQADEFLDAFRELIKKLPKFDSPHPIITQQIKGHRNVPAGFAKAAVDSVKDSPELQAVTVLKVPEVQSDIQQIEAYPRMFDEVEAWVTAGRFTLGVLQARANIVGQRALKVAEALATDPDYAHLGVRVEKMKDAKKKKRPATPQPSQPVQ